MGLFSKPSAPVSIDDALYDQAARYGMGIDEYLNGISNTYTPGSGSYTAEKGNPFFTGTNQPTMGKMSSKTVKRPFLWSGKNKSLKKVVNASYNAYWDNYYKQAHHEQYDTWKGPQIRPEYQTASNGLSQLGTPSYWQDNNSSSLFESEFDDLIAASSLSAPNPSVMEGSSDAMAEPMSSNPYLEGTGAYAMDDSAFNRIPKLFHAEDEHQGDTSGWEGPVARQLGLSQEPSVDEDMWSTGGQIDSPEGFAEWFNNQRYSNNG